MSLLSIDPGVKACAVAEWISGRLRCVGLWSAAPGCLFERVVWELPQADGRSVPVDTLIRLAAAGAELAGRCVTVSGEVVALQPRQWKGAVPKPPHHSELWKVLDPYERRILGGIATCAAIDAACERGGADRWQKDGKAYYRAAEFPSVDGLKISHDLLDAVALGAYDLRRLTGPAPTPKKARK